jgi:predicted enzyme related to lactoylglutathione lyase
MLTETVSASAQGRPASAAKEQAMTRRDLGLGAAAAGLTAATGASTAARDCRIDYIEFVTADIGRAKAFYQKAFGWNFTDYGPGYTSFEDGRLSGGFTTEGKVRLGAVLVVLHAPDLADAQRAVEAAGGRIVRQPFGFPGGRRFHFADPDGYELAVWSA